MARSSPTSCRLVHMEKVWVQLGRAVASVGRNGPVAGAENLVGAVALLLESELSYLVALLDHPGDVVDDPVVVRPAPDFLLVWPAGVGQQDANAGGGKSFILIAV